MGTFQEREYLVAGMTCEHCTAAVSAEVAQVAGVARVEVDLASKRVLVRGENVDDAAVRAAVEEAGYQAAPA
jgi:copper chaperone CopZ